MDKRLEEVFDTNPELKAPVLTVYTEWWTNDVFELLSWVFIRYSTVDFLNTRNEFSKMKILHRYIPKFTPEPLILWENEHWIAYRWAPWEMWNCSTSCDQFHDHDRLSSDLAEYISAFHSIPVEEFESVTMPRKNRSHERFHRVDKKDEWYQWKEFYHTWRKFVAHVGNNRKCFPLHKSYIVPCHNDLHSGNCIIDTKTWGLSWVVDFTEVWFWDMHTDFALLYLESQSICENTIEKYTRTTWVSIDIDRVRHYASIYALQYCFVEKSKRYQQARALITSIMKQW